VPGVERSRKLLFELLDGLREKGYPTDQTTFSGFSQGCLMSIEVGLRYPHRLAGIVGISGYVCEPEKLVREMSPVALQQRFLVTHGTLDPMIRFTVMREQSTSSKPPAQHRMARVPQGAHHHPSRNWNSPASLSAVVTQTRRVITARVSSGEIVETKERSNKGNPAS